MKKTYHLKLVSFITIIAVLASMLMTQAVFAADDGTMTFIDECNDFSKVYSRSGDLRIFNDQPQVMKDNDTGRIGRDISAKIVIKLSVTPMAPLPFAPSCLLANGLSLSS